MSPKRRDLLAWILRLTIVALTLATAYIHLTLGGLLFTANALGYVLFALLMLAPISLASRSRWLIRAALIGFGTGTIVAWVLFGARYWVAYLDKGIEIALIALLFVEMFRYDGGPLAVARRTWRLGLSILGLGLVMFALAGCGMARTPTPTMPPDAVVVAAEGDRFTDWPVITDPGHPMTVYFQITDFTQHNLRVWGGDTSIAATEIFSGPSARILELPPLTWGGEYRLTCDIHPGMQAYLEVW